ncbi:MAG: hypothetical protein J6V74_01565 [Bacteroidales bacterium]|nr:hypothetical protein [Bacteroidales bacterium]
MKRLFCFLFVCGLVLLAMADDGGARYPEDWTYGNIYVKEPNKSIALEKEYMYVSDEKINAVFCFRNTTDSTVIVPCAFPIVIKMPFRLENDTVMVGDFHSVNDTILWKIALDKDVRIKDVGYENKQLQMTKSEIEKYDKKLRVLKYSDYQLLYKQWMQNDKNEKYYKGCSIVQDGNRVELKNVGIETNVIFNESVKKYEFQSEVDLVLHFYHELKFQPNSLSKVSIEYYVNSLEGSYDGDSYEFYYDISTGGTWKDGKIGSFVLLTDYHIEDGTVKKWKESPKGLQTTRIIPYNVCSAKNYKPVGRFRFRGDDEDLNKMYERYFPSNEGRYFNQYNESKHISLRETGKLGIIKETAARFNPFIVDSAFRFSIEESCFGPYVANGYVDSAILKNNILLFNKEYERRDPQMPALQKDTLWQKYSRIKTVILTNIDEGGTDTLELEDRFPAYPYEVNSNFNDGWFGSNAVRDVRLLRPGSYTLTVNDIYRGDSTETVGVSHIWFYPVDPTLVSIIDEDKNSTMPLFSDVWRRVLDIHISDEKPNLGNVDFENDDNGSEGDNDVVKKDEQKQELPAERQVVKDDADISNSTALYVIVALVALSVLAVVIVVVRKRKSRSK